MDECLALRFLKTHGILGLQLALAMCCSYSTLSVWRFIGNGWWLTLVGLGESDGSIGMGAPADYSTGSQVWKENMVSW